MASPVLNDNTFKKYAQSGYFGQVVAETNPRYMTMEGTVNKTLILFALLLAAAAFTWTALLSAGGPAPWVMPLAFGSIFGAFIVGMVTSFRPQSAGITAPIYAILEGLALGAVSAIFNSMYHGIVVQAVALTFAVFAIMLTIYRTGLIRVTGQLRSGIIAATGAIFVLYMINMVMRLFGNYQLANFLWSSSPLSIGISVVVVGIAAFNLLLDFDRIDRGVAQRVPAFMEWYCGYGLMVTLVWLYLELLRLLAKLNNRR